MTSHTVCTCMVKLMVWRKRTVRTTNCQCVVRQSGAAALSRPQRAPTAPFCLVSAVTNCNGRSASSELEVICLRRTCSSLVVTLRRHQQTEHHVFSCLLEIRCSCRDSDLSLDGGIRTDNRLDDDLHICRGKWIPAEQQSHF